ncbi:hypothetical protein AM493_04820 [Flavobacterium akiainvivens]|uniref:Starch-binding protein n=2 Tax=Flavobacterium akiainvivens TaxID=1202724 RepID=A0A0M9VHD5_9FLAO|nr:hypothetical protein AM493_04820 [Flavobacterium akiainvivens]
MIYSSILRKARYIVASSLLAVMGCENYTEISQPPSQLSGQAVFMDKTTATAAILGIYAKMRDSGVLAGNTSGMTVLSALYADELIYFGSGGTSAESFYTNSLLAADPDIASIWNNTYNQVYSANAALEGLETSTLPMDVKAPLQGEAYFIRAILYYYLVNFFGDIPWTDTTDFNHNRLLVRTSQAEVYEKIIDDLQRAVDLLPDTGVSQKIRPDKFAAYTLLARAYLETGQYAQAQDAASTVIGSNVFSLETPEMTFLKGSNSTIFQFSPFAEAYNTDFGRSFISVQGPPPFGALSATLTDAFPEGDLRRISWIISIENNGQIWYFPFKYKHSTYASEAEEYPVVLRLSECFLIRAEAKARQGLVTEAREDLNMIRANAGLENSNTQDNSGLLEEILKEWQLEYFTEYGQRFITLKRFGLADQILEQRKPGWDSTDQLWPLPQSDILSNPNLEPQNPGY